MTRQRGWRRDKRESKKHRRLKKDFNEHYDNLHCACHTDPRVQSMLADTPKRCSCYMCGNPRRLGEVTRQERQFQEKFFHEILAA